MLVRLLDNSQKQYWELKSDNMDVVLFFKMGKFYELFDSDADVFIHFFTSLPFIVMLICCLSMYYDVMV
jgi:hypothetical protein